MLKCKEKQNRGEHEGRAIFWVIKSISSSKVSLKDRDKKSVLLDVGLVVISFIFLVVFSVKYFV
ncbi:hypothetical protein HMPREF1014_00201 [Bacillus sp. 7_6_55CFAA_CT2]|uniref:hypothetical protein n=1 Tax=Bacillus sp. 7_6_55CFAA_CT2 TaxID=665957 RepID=UPI0002411969|nr:hypothetical protein [Bacillus sp. 7_6_55CFAA_CT2]EHL77402.1 hypothetical protein HMPREF1014_00201 [Bacillus sp. 7_6_55CFAA_CT2]